MLFLLSLQALKQLFPKSRIVLRSFDNCVVLVDRETLIGHRLFERRFSFFDDAILLIRRSFREFLLIPRMETVDPRNCCRGLIKLLL